MQIEFYKYFIGSCWFHVSVAGACATHDGADMIWEFKMSLTPAALEDPSAYLDTAIMEMMKKIMEAVTHLMKSFEGKQTETQPNYLAFVFFI